MKLPLSIFAWLAMSPTVFAFEGAGMVGEDAITNSDVLPDVGGKGRTVGGHSLWSLSPFVQAGFSGVLTQYKILEESSGQETSVETTGSFTGTEYGATLQVKPDWQFLTPYLGFSYLLGTFDYNLETHSTLTVQNSLLASDLKSFLDFDVQTMVFGGGLRIGGEWGVTIEYAEVRRVLLVTRAVAVNNNTVDGEQEVQDAGEGSVSELFRELIGTRYTHNAARITVGISWRP